MTLVAADPTAHNTMLHQLIVDCDIDLNASGVPGRNGGLSDFAIFDWRSFDAEGPKYPYFGRIHNQCKDDRRGQACRPQQESVKAS